MDAVEQNLPENGQPLVTTDEEELGEEFQAADVPEAPEAGLAEGPEMPERSDAAEEAKEKPDDGRAWYVIHSYSGHENKVERNLKQRIDTMDMHEKIFRVVVPTQEEVEIRDGQRRASQRRVFPGYILVQMIMDEESWYVVRNTPGVTGFVGSENNPVPLSQEEVEKILHRMEEEQPRIKVSFRVGETVRITEGPFADFMAVVDDLYPERGKVRLLVSFFGRETPVEMDFLQVERI